MDDSAVVFAAATVVVAAATLLCQKKKKKQRKCWVKPWLRRREEGRGMLTMVDRELRTEDPSSYRNFLRMTEENFKEVLNLIQDDIKKEDTVMRCAISAETRLTLTLRFLATGESFKSLMYSTRIHTSTISKIVPEVCKAIFKRLRHLYLQCPQTPGQWREIAEKFQEMWGYPMCLGAIDGKHVAFRAPSSSGSYYFNYKGAHSIVLLALVDAECKFIYVDVGVNGRVSDGGVWRHTTLYKNLNRIGFPPEGVLPGTSSKVAYHFIGDDAFALSERLMKPYPLRNLSPDKLNFNYRLSKARRVAENAFGILANRFRVLLSTLNLGASKVDDIVLAAVALHNFLACKNRTSYMDASDDTMVQMAPLLPDPGQRSTIASHKMRDDLASYFYVTNMRRN